MKRDLDLCRALLLSLEKDDSVTGLKDYKVDDTTDEQVSYHVKLLYEAGLIEAHDASTMNNFKWYPLRLTWDGHEFLDTARDDIRWQKAKTIVLNKTGGLAFDFIKATLFKLVEL